MERTFETVMADLNSLVTSRQSVSPEHWLSAAQFLNLFVEDIQGRQFDLEQKIAIKKMEAIENGDTVSKANVRIQTLPEFTEARKLKAKIERAIELCRIAKLQARMSQDIYATN